MRVLPPLLLASSVLHCGAPAEPGVSPADSRPPLECLHQADCARVMVCAHRGLKTRAAENTLAAVADALALGVDAVEVDVRTTADGVLVILHDPDVDRTTYGSGALSAMTAAEARALVVRQPPGAERPDGSFIPTLSEVLALVDGRAWVDIDLKEASVAALVAALAAAGATDQVVIFEQDEAVLAALHQAEPRLWLMPAAADAAAVGALAGRLPFAIVYLDSNLLATIPAGFVDAATAAGAKVFLDVMGVADVAGMTGDSSLWLERAASGLKVMQTDAPEELIAALRANGFR
ncbi:MAG: glycerophosphodiester phosphodiesterase family protein [Deltaproteobacteria bacterium]|nr:glycerophosphodiester phosphodiesterase family protein [Deltaproteobacteria bacterium]